MHLCSLLSITKPLSFIDAALKLWMLHIFNFASIVSFSFCLYCCYFSSFSVSSFILLPLDLHLLLDFIFNIFCFSFCFILLDISLLLSSCFSSPSAVILVLLLLQFLFFIFFSYCCHSLSSFLLPLNKNFTPSWMKLNI